MKAPAKINHGTSIEWTQRPGTRGETLNPIRARNKETGKRGWYCSHVNLDCINCYAEALNLRGGDSGGNGIAYKAQLRDRVEIYLDEDTLLRPLSWRAPRTIFMCSMTDIFGDFVMDEWLDKVFAVAALCPQHTFIVLTKRPKRARSYLTALTHERMMHAVPQGTWPITHHAAAAKLNPTATPEHRTLYHTSLVSLPLPNVWLGTSCGDQGGANEFVPELLVTPAAVRFLSVEPMRGQVDLTRITRETDRSAYIDNALTGFVSNGHMGGHDGPRVDWVICGGESGPRARPMHPDWARALRDDCTRAGVPFFFKQWGESAPRKGAGAEVIAASQGAAWPDGTVGEGHRDRNGGCGVHIDRIGKKAAGRELDGRTHNAFPEVST